MSTYNARKRLLQLMNTEIDNLWPMHSIQLASILIDFYSATES